MAPVLAATSVVAATWFLLRLLTATPFIPRRSPTSPPPQYLPLALLALLPLPPALPVLSVPTALCLAASWLLATLTALRYASEAPAPARPSLPRTLLHRPDLALYAISISVLLAFHAPSPIRTPIYLVLCLASILLSLSATRESAPLPIRLRSAFSLAIPHDAMRPVPPHPRNASAFTMLSFDWMTPTVSTGRMRSLEEQDVLPLASHLATDRAGRGRLEPLWREEFSRRRPDGTPISPNLLRALFRAFGARLAIGGILKFVNDICVFISPVILRVIILHLQDRDKGIGTAFRGFLLACALLATYTTQSLVFNQYFNISSTVQVLLRGSLVSAIFSKSCRLSPESRALYTSGQIQNLMSTDSRTVSDVVLYIHMLWSSLEQIIVALFLLVQLLGWRATFAGVLFIIATMPLQGYFVATIKALREIVSSKTDERVKSVSEAIKGIKLVKLYAWELSFVRRILDDRARELDYLRRVSLLQAWSSTLFSSLPTMLTVTAFAVFASTGRTLNAAVVFPAIALFNVIRPPLLFFPSTIINAARAAASLNRLQNFLTAEELIPINESEHAVDQEFLSSNNLDIMANNASFTWDPSISTFNPTLCGVSFQVPEGSLVAIVGPTGGGKSSLLAGLLGELPIIDGQAGIREGRSICFCDQVPFIQNATLRENILFGKPYNDALYRKTVEVCCLLPDLKILPGGDLTEIGGRGVNLSGGQRARVSLARAVYSRADICILDDPLCAVDAHVGRALFNNCIVDELRGKTRLLTTNQIHFAASPDVDIVVVVQNGTILEAGHRTTLLASPLSEFAKLVEAAGEMGTGEIPEGETNEPEPQRASNIEEDNIQENALSAEGIIPSNEGVNMSSAGIDGDSSSLLKKPVTNYGAVEAGKLTRKEGKNKGRVSLKHYVTYFKAMGPVQWVLPIAVFAFLAQVASLSVNVWLSIWSEQSTNPDVEDRTLFNLMVFLGIGLASVMVTSGSAFSLAFGSIRASILLHERLLLSVFGAPSSFFNRTPEGRLVNRFNSDIDKVDSTLGSTLQSLLRLLLNLLFTLGLIVWATPVFIFVIIPIAFVCVYVQEFYRMSSVDLRRLEAVARSPLYSQFGETLDGVVTIRAYGDVPRASHMNSTYADRLNKASYASVSANRWLAIRLEALGTVLIFGATTMAVLSPPGKMSSSMTGLVLSYTMQILGAMTWSVRQFTETESQLSAIERVSEYSDPPFPQEEVGGLEACLRDQNTSSYQTIRNESKGLISKDKAEQLSSSVQPRRSRWPKKGRVDFKEVCMKYREDLEPALKSVSFAIMPGEHIGIVGRTGAGKSSAIQSLFRLYELESGQIVIDGVDISTLKLFDLRSSLGIIPQEPFCFSGTIRSNLDMFGEHEDSSVQNALDSCGLQDTMKEKVGLEFEVAEGGSNLSVGQRQLLCLGRALLRDSQILVLDEATSSVSNETDEKFQQTLRNEMNHCTILTVAHRLHTVMRNDRIIVMDKGRIGEMGRPSELLSGPSMLSDLVDETGPSTAAFLRQLAAMPSDHVNSRVGAASSSRDFPSFRHTAIIDGTVVRTPSYSDSRETLQSRVRSAFVELRSALLEADSAPWNDELANEGVDPTQWRRQLQLMVSKLNTFSENMTGEVAAVGGNVDGFVTDTPQHSSELLSEFAHETSPRPGRPREDSGSSNSDEFSDEQLPLQPVPNGNSQV